MSLSVCHCQYSNSLDLENLLCPLRYSKCNASLTSNKFEGHRKDCAREHYLLLLASYSIFHKSMSGSCQCALLSSNKFLTTTSVFNNSTHSSHCQLSHPQLLAITTSHSIQQFAVTTASNSYSTTVSNSYNMSTFSKIVCHVVYHGSVCGSVCSSIMPAINVNGASGSPRSISDSFLSSVSYVNVGRQTKLVQGDRGKSTSSTDSAVQATSKVSTWTCHECSFSNSSAMGWTCIGCDHPSCKRCQAVGSKSKQAENRKYGVKNSQKGGKKCERNHMQTN